MEAFRDGPARVYREFCSAPQIAWRCRDGWISVPPASELEGCPEVRRRVHALRVSDWGIKPVLCQQPWKDLFAAQAVRRQANPVALLEKSSCTRPSGSKSRRRKKPQAEVNSASLALPANYAIHVRYSPGIPRACAVYSPCSQRGRIRLCRRRPPPGAERFRPPHQ
jgi:hypothetical protein